MWKTENFTVVRFEEFTGGGVEVLQFKIIGSFQSHAEAFRVPTFPPQDVLWESSRPGAHIPKIKQLALPITEYGLLRMHTHAHTQTTGIVYQSFSKLFSKSPGVCMAQLICIQRRPQNTIKGKAHRAEMTRDNKKIKIFSRWEWKLSDSQSVTYHRLPNASSNNSKKVLKDDATSNRSGWYTVWPRPPFIQSHSLPNGPIRLRFTD